MRCDNMLSKSISEFCKEYDVPREAIDDRYMTDSQLGHNIIGMTWFKWSPDIEPICTLGVIEWFAKYPLATHAVAWHEFCHAESWIKSRESDGHNKRWIGRMWRKPLLYILDSTYVDILFLILKAKHRSS